MRFLLISFCLFFFCYKQDPSKAEPQKNLKKYRYSLSQWSYNKELFSGEMNTIDFIYKVKEMGFDGVDFVSQFFQEKSGDKVYLDSLKAALSDTGLAPAMIMVDLEGELGSNDPIKRKEAIKGHKEWIDAAKSLGCPFIRVNAHGEGTAEEMMVACISSITKLAIYAKQQGIGIMIENHGTHSSDGSWLSALVDKLKPLGVRTLADFDNWCIERENGKLWGAPCINRYDEKKGMQELMPYANAISVKAFDFDKDGNETKLDFPALFDILHKHNYDGYFGIEYEGNKLSTEKGIMMTRALAEKLNAKY